MYAVHPRGSFTTEGWRRRDLSPVASFRPAFCEDAGSFPPKQAQD